ncbi:MAG: efflux RND transporter periplasmic adaptor subunit [Vampirovibrionales bacterium]
MAKEHTTHIRSEAKALLSAYGVNTASIHSEKIYSGSPVIAPKSGVVLEKNITLGSIVTPQTVMYTLANLNRVWLDLTVYAKDYAKIRPGAVVRFTLDSLPNQTFTGTINYLPPQAVPSGQTFIARAFLNNANHVFKPGMFVSAHIETPLSETLPFIPTQAVQRYQNGTFVFEVLSPGVFRKQTVVLGQKVGDGYVVKEGLEIGKKIVTQGSFTLKAEMLKGEFEEGGH